jgi:hypothetical protein
MMEAPAVIFTDVIYSLNDDGRIQQEHISKINIPKAKDN